MRSRSLLWMWGKLNLSIIIALYIDLTQPPQHSALFEGICVFYCHNYTIIHQQSRLSARPTLPLKRRQDEVSRLGLGTV